MSAKVLKAESPVSQSIEAVMALLESEGVHRTKPPASVKLSDLCFLVLSAACDQYYVTTRRGCSCPSSVYRPRRTCKHQRKYLGMKDPGVPVKSAGWLDGRNGPVMPEVA